MGKRKYKTEEERKTAKRERSRQYYQNNKEKIAKRHAEYYKNNKEKILEQQAEWYQVNREENLKRAAEYYQNNKEKLAEYYAEYQKNNKEKIAKRKAEYYQNNKEKITEYYQNNKEKIAKRKAEYYQNNKEKITEYKAEYRSTKYGRAKCLLSAYRKNDRQNKVIKALNRGECTLTAEWIVDNIFSGQSCVYCGESDWMKMGCDRKDSWFPHTPENCVPCCNDCNTKKGTTPYDLYMKMIGKIA